MTTQIFLFLLFVFSLITSSITEAIKKLVNDKKNMPYNIVALIVALIVGCGGTAIYYQLNGLPFDTNNIIYMIIMSLASGVCSMVGFDKVKQTILQIKDSKKTQIE